MEIRRQGAGSRPIIESYGTGGFRVSGVVYPHSILVLPTRTEPWAVDRMSALTPQSLTPVAEHGDIEILLLGCGAKLQQVPRAVRDAMKAVGIVVDAMDTRAACRTYNVLAAEERRVAVALISLATAGG